MAPPHEFFHASHNLRIPDFRQEDISIRPFDLSDVDAYMTWASDEKVHEFFVADSPLSTKEEALEELENGIIPHPWYRAICLGGLPIGYVRFDEGQRQEGSIPVGQIGYGLAARYWGRGITTIAVKLAVSAIFKELRHIQEIEALIVKENMGSRKVIEKVGFDEVDVLTDLWTVQGRKRDVVLYNLFRSDYLYQQKYLGTASE